MSGFSFFLSPDKAYEYLKAKKPKLSFHYDEVLKEAHQKAFTVAKVTKLDLLSDIQDSLVRSMKEGIKFDDWKEQIEPTLKKKGWFSKTEVVNQSTGEVKTIDVNSSRLKTIYDVNMRTAYAKGRYESQMSSIGEYFYYGAILDDGTRTEHRALHGTVLHKSDPFWDQNYAPNGYRCRCKIRVYTKKQLERKGLKPTTTRPPNVFDKDWGYNPGKVDNTKVAYKQKVDALTCKSENAKSKRCSCSFIELVKKEYRTHDDVMKRSIRKQQLNDMVDQLIVKENKKYPLNYIEVGEINKNILKALQDELGVDLKNSSILLEKNRLLHASPKRKSKYKQALRVEEMRQIDEVLEEAKEVYIDISQKHKNLIYTFQDTKDAAKINKIAIDLNRTVKKFGVASVVLTLSKVKKEDLKKEEYIRVK